MNNMVQFLYANCQFVFWIGLVCIFGHLFYRVSKYREINHIISDLFFTGVGAVLVIIIFYIVLSVASKGS